MRAPDPVSDLKQQLAEKVLELIDGLSSSWAAWDTHLSRSRISEMRNGNLRNVSLDRLVRCLAQLDHSVEVTITRNRRWGI